MTFSEEDFESLGEWAAQRAQDIRKAMSDYLTPGPQDEEFQRRSTEVIREALAREES